MANKTSHRLCLASYMIQVSFELLLIFSCSFPSTVRAHTYLTKLPSAQHQMNTAVRANNVADLPNLQPIRRVFKRLLHLSTPKPSKVTTVRVRRTIRVLRRQFRELVSGSVDFRFMFSQYLNSLLFCTGNVLLYGILISLNHKIKNLVTHLFPA